MAISSRFYGRCLPGIFNDCTFLLLLPSLKMNCTIP